MRFSSLNIYFTILLFVLPGLTNCYGQTRLSKEILADHTLLAKALTQSDSTDEDKIYSICQWISDNIKYDYRAVKKDKLSNFDPSTILKKKKAVCAGYSNLFDQMCAAIDIDCYVVSGHVKENGKLIDESLGSHAWNVVKLDGYWYTVDVTWASGHIRSGFHLRKYQKDFDQKWLMMEPKYYLQSHLPEDPMWQLIDQPINFKMFKQDPNKLMARLGKTGSYFNFRDSIVVFQQLEELNQVYLTAVRTYQFNRKNTFSKATLEYMLALKQNVKIYEEHYDPSSKIELIEQAIWHYEESLKYLNKTKSNRRVVKDHIDDLKLLINDSLISSKKRIAAITYSEIKDSVVAKGLGTTTRYMQEVQDWLGQAINLSISKNQTSKLELLLAEYLNHVGASLVKDASHNESKLPVRNSLKQAHEYLSTSQNLYLSHGGKPEKLVAEQIQGLLDEINTLENK